MSLLTDYQQLLRDLKGIVEGLLISQVANVWNVYGGLNRLHSVIENVFKHQLKAVNNEGNLDCWLFVQGLNWLQPDITTSTLSVDSEYQPHLPTHLKTDKVSLWLYRSLESHTLSQKLSWLLSDKEHLMTCYHENAFMLQEKYTEATLICLRAVERNEPSLLSEIDPCLFINCLKDFHKSHRRCSSFPDTIQHRKWTVLPKKLSTENIRTDIVDKIIEKPEKPSKIRNVYGKLKPWRSMPNLILETIKIRRRSSTFAKSYSTNPNSPVHREKLSPSLIQVNYSDLVDSQIVKRKKPPFKSKKQSRLYQSKSSGALSDQKTSKSLPCENKVDSFNLAINLVRSAPDYSFSVLPGEKDYKKRPKKTFIEDGGSSILPMATGFFPKPVKGQTLTSFLSSSQFSRTNAELDRENAHFSISEAMIAAIEQIKWKRDLKQDEEQVESDEEINNLKQRIRMRRKQKQEEKKRKVWELSLEKKLDSFTTDASASPFSSSLDSLINSISSEEVEDMDIDEAATLAEQKGLSMSMASLYSEADLLKRPRGVPDGASDILSAEGVALSLISKFNEKQLPRASDLEWLVSEQDAPQQLLPLPKSWPISPDEYTSLRGTSEWAPPRPQIIFTIHPVPVRKILMAKQNYRCAGCGMKVAPQYASRFRYCDYLGRYFCTGCHTNQLSLIPGKVLQKWDFNRYPVSNFSYRLLEQMFNDPLFCVIELNKGLFRRSKALEKCRNLRWQLFYLKDFILNCRYAETEQELLQKQPSYVISDPELYSLSDFGHIKSGDFLSKLKNLIETCGKHSLNCELCMARGFICEICEKKEPIFPWQMGKVDRCDKCGSCYHATCWKSLGKHCSKCARIEERTQAKT